MLMRVSKASLSAIGRQMLADRFFRPLFEKTANHMTPAPVQREELHGTCSELHPDVMNSFRNILKLFVLEISAPDRQANLSL